MVPEDVSDFESFLAFVRWIAADRADEAAKGRLSPTHPLGPGRDGRENTTVEDFLEAAAACAGDHSAKMGRPPEASWREFANFLLGGKVYE